MISEAVTDAMMEEYPVDVIIPRFPEYRVIRMVDYEAVSYNYRAWEIAMHFQRYAGLTTFDLNLIPDENFQLAWLRVYLEKHYEVIGRDRNDVKDSEIRRLYVQVQKFHLVALIVMGLAGPAMEDTGMLPPEANFDMIGWSILAVNEYFKIKDRIFALQMPDDSI